VFDSIISFLRYIIGKNKDFKFKIRKITGFYPKKIKFYQKALIHRSASTLNKNGEIVNNERLEYLGDAVLDVIIGDFLFRKYPEADEGFLTQTRSKLVNKNTLFDLAKNIKLHRLIILHNNQNISKKNIYGDAFEAFIGAIYLDKGFKKTYKFVIDQVINKFLNLDKIVDFNNNYKSILIEWSQKYKKQVLFYTDLESVSSKYFISYVRIDNQNWGEGIAFSKKEAEQKAAKNAIEKIEENSELFEINNEN
jgi:ribonuclease-3